MFEEDKLLIDLVTRLQVVEMEKDNLVLKVGSLAQEEKSLRTQLYLLLQSYTGSPKQ